MIAPSIDSQPFKQKIRRIRSQVSAVLTRRGLLPRFKRWRLTQDPDTGMIVLFGILNNKYIAAYTSIPFSDYFASALLRDLANEVQMEVVSCNGDSLRYAFILDRGKLGRLPTHIDFPFVDDGKILARVVYRDTPRSIPVSFVEDAMVDDHILIHQGIGAFLKVFDDIKLRDGAALQSSALDLPAIVIINEDEFNKQVAEHEANRQRIHRIRNLFDES